MENTLEEEAAVDPLRAVVSSSTSMRGLPLTIAEQVR